MRLKLVKKKVLIRLYYILAIIQVGGIKAVWQEAPNKGTEN